MKTPEGSRSRRGARQALGAAAALLVALGADPADAADTQCDSKSAAFPCGFELQDHKLQKVPQQLKFHARVSQAKMPTGEGVFSSIIVNLLSGSRVVCTEPFTNVRVTAGVLNLTIGGNLDCQLDEVLAEHPSLAFQVCLGGPESCLAPVPMTSTPYALKSSFSATAKSAERANQAGTATYAHRGTADSDLQLSHRLGTGYFDFHTDATAGTYGSAYGRNDGFLAWTPVRNRDALELHLVAKRADTEGLGSLGSVVLESESTEATGRLTVGGATTVSTGGLRVLQGGADITGDSSVTGTLHVTGQARLHQGVFVTRDSADVTGDVIVRGGGLGVEGATTLGGALAVTGDTTLQSDLGVTGDTTLASTLSVVGPATLAGGVAGSLSIAGGGLRVEGSAVFRGPVVFSAGTVISGQPNPIPNTVESDAGGSTLFINRDASGPAAGTYDLVMLAGNQGMVVGTGSDGVTLEGDAQIQGTAAFARDVSVGGRLDATSITVGGQPVAVEHPHPYSAVVHGHAGTRAPLVHTHDYSAPVHSHTSQYSAPDHGHSSLATESHSHGNYSFQGHSHSDVALASHGHSDLSLITHDHGGYATKLHFHGYAASSHTHASAGGSSAAPGVGECIVIEGPKASGVGSNDDNHFLGQIAMSACSDDYPIMKKLDWQTESGAMYFNMTCCKMQ